MILNSMSRDLRRVHVDGYRRGMVLGLTMAEAVILVLFILILVATATSMRKDAERKKIEDDYGIQLGLTNTARTLLEKVTQERDEFSRRVALLQEEVAKFRSSEAQLREHNNSAVAEIEKIKSERSVMAATLVLGAENLRQLRSELLSELRERFRIDSTIPDEKVIQVVSIRMREAEGAIAREKQAVAALEARWSELVEPLRLLLRRAGLNPSNDDVARPSELLQKFEAILNLRFEVEELKEKMFSLQGENTSLRNQLSRAIGVGGAGLPHCWSTAAGDAVFLLRVAMFDGDIVVVQERSKRERPEDNVWSLMDGIPREKKMTMDNLKTSFSRLLADARARRCKYAVEALDQTGASNKNGYKRLRGTLNEMFFVRETRTGMREPLQQ
jgi:hypothetical protein